jgi:hypothetical protein
MRENSSRNLFKGIQHLEKKWVEFCIIRLVSIQGIQLSDFYWDRGELLDLNSSPPPTAPSRRPPWPLVKEAWWIGTSIFTGTVPVSGFKWYMKSTKLGLVHI